MRSFLKGVHLPHRKGTAASVPEKMSPPERVTIPMSMHIGKPARIAVAVGDGVKVGTLIGEQDGFVSSPVYSSVSGTVEKLVKITGSAGREIDAVCIKSDGLMTPDENIKPPVVGSAAELVAAIRDSGIVGLGGAGFPTYVKFSLPENAKDLTLVVNGAECEPFITSDTRTMLDRTEGIKTAIDAILTYLPVTRVIVGIEKNKPEAIASMAKMAEGDERIEIKTLPSLYPQGGEKVLVYHTTGRVIPAGKLPLEVGCIVANCTTLATIGEYLQTGMPLVEKCITVDGSAVARPKNIIVPIGVSAGECFEFAGGFSVEPKKMLLGGPMMGIAMDTVDTPITKNTNAILAFGEREAKPKRETPCIRCGACALHCPFKLDPAAYMRAYKSGDMEKLAELRVDICMECGCCSYICPAGQKLVQNNKLSKIALREYNSEKEKRGELKNE